MKKNGSARIRLMALLAAVAALLVSGRPLAAKVLDKTTVINGTTLHYKVVLPEPFDAAKSYPTVLAFPGGPQTTEMVEGTLQRNWRVQAETHGYIVVIPEAPDGQLFFEEGTKYFPAFIELILKDYKVLDGKFHIAGVSNGGLSAFQIAASYPQYFWSITGLPGFLIDATPDRIKAISKLCINMYAGQNDPEWLLTERKQAEQFRAQGLTVEFNEEKGEGHVMRTLDGDGGLRLFKQFEQARSHACGK